MKAYTYLPVLKDRTFIAEKKRVKISYWPVLFLILISYGVFKLRPWSSHESKIVIVAPQQSQRKIVKQNLKFSGMSPQQTNPDVVSVLPQSTAQPVRTTASVDQGVLGVQSGVMVKEFTIEEYNLRHPDKRIDTRQFSPTDRVTELTPKDPNEPEIPSAEVKFDCPSLADVESPLVFRVNSGGNVIEAINPLNPLGTVVLGPCRILGGPSKNYTTTYEPNQAN